VLAALHDLSLAALFCDTVHLITDGHIVAGGHPRSVITTETIRHAYGADVLIIDHPETGTPHLIPRRFDPGLPNAAHPLARPTHPE
jgi:iron complex transport system ATP-binding protein